MGGAVSTGADNDDLVDNLVEADYIKTPLVEKVFRAVDRAHYYLAGEREAAYKDLAWRHEHLHMSAPCIYSEVMEALQLEAGLSFLNLGSGTGYLSTMVGLVLGPYGVNHGVEQYEDVVDYAQARLEEFKERSAAIDEFDFCEPMFVVGNCLQLNSGCHLYDRVYVGAGCPSQHENYMKNLIKVGGVLVMPINDRLIQAKRLSETEWEINNKLPVSFATLASPDPDKPPELIDLPDAHQPTLQELCRTTVRRVIRTNIHKRHPDLSKVKKRRRKPKRKSPPGALSNLNIVPLSMGMMILQQQFDHDRSDSDDADDDSDDDDQPLHNNAQLDTLQEDQMEELDSDEGPEEEGEEGTFSSSDDSFDAFIQHATDRNAHSNKLDEVEDAEEVLETENVNDNGNQDVVVANGKADVGIANGKADVDVEKGELLSDYASDEDGRIEDEIQQVAEANDNTEFTTNSGVNDNSANVITPYIAPSLYNQHIEAITPPDTNWSDSDDDADTDNYPSKKYSMDEMLQCGARAKNSDAPRKQRYSSNTSVDTSTTSGIGSYNEEHFDAEMEPDTHSENLVPSLTLPVCMREDIDTLPLPSALKAYLKHYRE